MTKSQTIFVCENCGAQFPKWSGQCFECGKWGSLGEQLIVSSEQSKKKEKGEAAEILRVTDVTTDNIERMKTGIGEVDRVLGGGIVQGSIVLFAGEPGIGKSTLLTQIALSQPLTSIRQLADQLPTSIFYVCGEESPNQVKMRIKRLSGNNEGKNFDTIFLYPETNVDEIILNLKSKISNLKFKNSLLIVDSIQTLTTDDLTGIAGSIGQVRECTHRLINFAKETQTPVFLVGHITKEGQLAGPKTIEHSVDTVLYFEGERTADLRLLRSVKNRFGPTDEVGVFQMTEKGLTEIKDPSFLSGDKSFAPKVGSSYTVVFEGTRPLVAEIQALVVKSFSPIPKRVVNGLEKNRSEMLLAVLQKYLKLPLWSYDVFLNVGAGLKVKDPASDLAVCSAVTSSFKNKTFVASSIFCGEVSLLGEVKEVSRMEKRVKQAKSLGFKNFFSGKNFERVEELRKLVGSE